MRIFLSLLLSLTIISCSPVGKYKNLPEVRSWENDIEKFEQLDKSTNYPKDAVLFAGSSSIKLWSTLEADMAPYPVIQRGYGGAKLSDFAVYADRIIAPHPCRAIVLFIANDITGGEADKSPREIVSLCRHTLKIIRNTHPDTPVFWIAITPSAARWNAWSEIKKANNAISHLCSQKSNTWFIATDFAFLDEKGNPRTELFRDDKLHLNNEGYKIWSDIIKKALQKVIPVAVDGNVTF